MDDPRVAILLALALALLAGPGCPEDPLYDFDGDGSVNGEDCAPEDPDIYPGQTEDCEDGIDNDCDGDVDGGDGDCFSPDNDGDGWTVEMGDCDDTDATINPDRPEEICDGDDNDCDPQTPDEPDEDSDGYSVCDSPPDCDDEEPAVNPGGSEAICDGLDNDCDGDTADAPDGDGDGYDLCFPADAGDTDGEEPDCQDDDAAVHPGAAEVCGDGVDNDCDGTPNQCGFLPTYSLGDADAIITGEWEWDYAGTAVSAIGDVDSDGFGDLAVGARGAGGGAGAVYLLRGPLSGTVSLSYPAARFDGENYDDYAGVALAPAGNAGGAGAGPFVLVGARQWPQANCRGAAYLIDGSVTGAHSLSGATARFLGEASLEYAGYAVAGPGDVDGDTVDDVLIGAPGANDSDGLVYLLHGPFAGDIDLNTALVLFEGLAGQGEALGDNLSSGDVGGDAATDILLGAPWQGRVYVFHGPLPVQGVHSVSSAQSVLDSGVGSAGESVGVGDIDADGDDDVLVGVEFDATGAFLIRDPTTGQNLLENDGEASFLAEGPEDFQNGSVAIPGDLDADGNDDLLIGHPQFAITKMTDVPGAAYLFLTPPSGATSLADADVRFYGEQNQDQAGSTVGGAGDVNGDGVDDLFVAAECGQNTGDCAGTVYVFYGRPGL